MRSSPSRSSRPAGHVSSAGATTRVNFVSARDVARFVELAVMDPAIRGVETDVAGPQNLSLNRVLQVVGAATGKTGSVSHAPVPMMRLMSAVLRPVNPVAAGQNRGGPAHGDRRHGSRCRRGAQPLPVDPDDVARGGRPKRLCGAGLRVTGPVRLQDPAPDLDGVRYPRPRCRRVPDRIGRDRRHGRRAVRRRAQRLRRSASWASPGRSTGRGTSCRPAASRIGSAISGRLAGRNCGTRAGRRRSPWSRSMVRSVTLWLPRSAPERRNRCSATTRSDPTRPTTWHSASRRSRPMRRLEIRQLREPRKPATGRLRGRNRWSDAQTGTGDLPGSWTLRSRSPVKRSAASGAE